MVPFNLTHVVTSLVVIRLYMYSCEGEVVYFIF